MVYCDIWSIISFMRPLIRLSNAGQSVLLPHRNFLQMNKKVFTSYPYNHFYDDNDFIKCIEELSLSSDIAARLLNNTKVLNPFDINEDDDDIIEYHGDIDPDKCYFNEYSHNFFKNCNYYTEDSFNRYLAKHVISNNSFSVAHLNIRSIPANLSAFLSFIDSLDHCFTVIGLS